MEQRLAVIDLGTNTFHLLIVAFNDKNDFWEEVYRERKYVYLAEEGIETIGSAAIKRGLDTLTAYSIACKKYNVIKAKAFGTAALRSASNGAAFVTSAKDLFPYNIEIIDGNTEANLIAKGVALAIPSSHRKQLIMDIGGGSVEFILSQASKVIWAKSFNIGVAVLFKKFHNNDPISRDDQNELSSFLTTTLLPLNEQLRMNQVDDLIGASGTFDVLEKLLVKNEGGENYSFLSLKSFPNLLEKMISTTLQQRKELPNLPVERAELIIVALLLIDHILRLHPFKNLLVSHFAMKEGMILSLK